MRTTAILLLVCTVFYLRRFSSGRMGYIHSGAVSRVLNITCCLRKRCNAVHPLLKIILCSQILAYTQ